MTTNLCEEGRRQGVHRDETVLRNLNVLIWRGRQLHALYQRRECGSRVATDLLYTHTHTHIHKHKCS